MKLALSYYVHEDVVGLARSFLGKILVTNFDGRLSSGIITETEAYAGVTDRASHAFGGRHTVRTAPMYEAGGIAYVYLIYGIHSLFNIVTGPAGMPHAVLIRAIEPLDGLTYIIDRRKVKKMSDLCVGPGKVSEALGIHYSNSGLSLLGERIWIEDRRIEIEENNIISGPRINVDYADEDAKLPYRFCLQYL